MVAWIAVIFTASFILAGVSEKVAEHTGFVTDGAGKSDALLFCGVFIGFQILAYLVIWIRYRRRKEIRTHGW